MKVQKVHVEYLKEDYFVAKIDNGLTIYLLPKRDFSETYVSLTSHFGAIHTSVSLSNDEERNYPAGVAHFLEHKLFEMEDGQDAIQEFSSYGAEANAYTGLTQTSYLFSTTENILAPLALLQEMVSSTKFTELSIEREREIIAQEIDMYLDDPEFVLHNQILASLYPNTPLAEDIAGTRTSIQEITPKILRESHEVFYHPSNLTMVIVGSFDVDKALQEVYNFQMNWHPGFARDKKVRQLELNPVIKKKSQFMEVAQAKLAFGVRRNQVKEIDDILYYRTCLSLFCSMLFGWTSERYQRLYEDGKIDSAFSYYVDVQQEFQYFVLTMDTKEPIGLAGQIRRVLKNFEEDRDLSEEHLSLLKKEMMGDFLRSLNSVGFLAQQFIENLTVNRNYFDLPQLLEEISLEDVINIAKDFLENCDMTDFIIFPK